MDLYEQKKVEGEMVSGGVIIMCKQISSLIDYACVLSDETFMFQDCCQYHQAKDGDGWVEYKGSLDSDLPQKVYNFL